MIGDVLITSILFNALRDKYPNAKLYYLINSHTYPVVEHNPNIDKYIFYTKEIEASNIKFLKFLKGIRSEKFDTIIDAYSSVTSALTCLFSNSKFKIAYFKNYTFFAYTQTIERLKKPKNNASLAIENRFKLLGPLGISFKNYTPKIFLTDKEITIAKSILKQNKISLEKSLFMISVLGSSPEKTYPFQYMATLIDAIVLNNPETQILFNYIPKQESDAKMIFDLCLKNTQKQIFFNVFGKDLRSFLALTSLCNALIGNEGGANNMAKALGLPTLTIFSPYLNKVNWFGENETEKNVAIHLSDYINITQSDIVLAKKTPKPFYLKLKPDFIIPQLTTFLNNVY